VGPSGTRFPALLLDVADPDLPPELVADYLERLRIVRDELTGLLTSPAGADQIRRLAHQLRGSGASFGFPGVSAHAGQVEDASPGLLPEAVRALVAHLDEVAPPLRARILLVDDDPNISRLLANVLAGPDREVVAAETAPAADAELARGRFDLILLDLFLADEDGRRLLERWRTAPATSATPIFILSATLGPEIKTECFRLGADNYFEKPFDPPMLAAAVTSTLQRRGAPAVPTPVPPSTPAPPDRPAAILLADDDPLIASIVRHRMEKAGHRVTHVADGGAALRAIEGAPPDILILDVKMPELDGLTVLRQLRADPRLRTLPVILLTALGEEQDVIRGFSLGADDYLAKPFSPAELGVRVDRLLRRP
jgi:DNA-binding response OmpR family regulator